MLVRFFFISLFAIASNIFSQDKSVMEKFESKTHEFNSTYLPYRFFSPEIEDGQVYPVILALHGSGERGNDNETQINANKLATIWVEAENQNDHPCFVIAPQCPKNNRWVDSNWDLDTFDFKLLTISNELSAFSDLLKKVVNDYPVDRARIYITGLSMGGFGTWYMLLKHPSLFAAAIPICGAGDPNLACSIEHIPIWNFHGDIDKSVNVEGSRLMMSALENCKNDILLIPNPNSKEIIKNEETRNNILNSNLIYTEYKGKSHSIWNETYENPLVREWLFSKRLRDLM